MRKIITHAAGVAAAVAVGFGIVAVTAPSADAASRGTVTKSEARKVIREGGKQRCLTLKETRKIVHGNGKRVSNLGGYSDYKWKGAKGSGVVSLWVSFKGGCAILGESDFKNGDYLSFLGR